MNGEAHGKELVVHKLIQRKDKMMNSNVNGGKNMAREKMELFMIIMAQIIIHLSIQVKVAATIILNERIIDLSTKFTTHMVVMET